MASFPPRIVHTVAKADIGQRNPTLNLTKMANLFRKTYKGAPTTVLPTPIGAFGTAINIREFREMHSFRLLCSHPRKCRA